MQRSVYQLLSRSWFPVGAAAAAPGLGLLLPQGQQQLQAAAYAKKAAAPAAASKPAPAKPAPKKEAKPKIPRALGPWTIFVQERASGRKDQPATQLIKQLAAEWRAMTDAQKAPYLDAAARSKQRAAGLRAEAKAARPPPSAYASFAGAAVQQLRAQQPGLPNTAYIKLAAERWRALPERERERLTVQAKAAKDAWQQAQPPSK